MTNHIVLQYIYSNVTPVFINQHLFIQTNADRADKEDCLQRDLKF